jgi:ATP-dependent Clp protease ATP-binding subunit ClpA
MYVDDLDCLADRLNAATQRVVDRALEESRRRDHAVLTTAHMWFAVANTEWDLFASTLRGVEANPRDVLRAIEEHLRLVPSQCSGKMQVSPPMKLVCRLALHHAARAGHSTVEAADLLLALFDEPQGVPGAIVRRLGVEPDVLASRLDAHFRERE